MVNFKMKALITHPDRLSEIEPIWVNIPIPKHDVVNQIFGQTNESDIDIRYRRIVVLGTNLPFNLDDYPEIKIQHLNNVAQKIKDKVSNQDIIQNILKDAVYNDLVTPQNVIIFAQRLHVNYLVEDIKSMADINNHIQANIMYKEHSLSQLNQFLRDIDMHTLNDDYYVMVDKEYIIPCDNVQLTIRLEDIIQEII